MLVLRRILFLFACSWLSIAVPSVNAAPSSLLIGPALPSSVGPVEAGPPSVAPVDKRTQNTEQLRFAQRKLEANGATDKAAALEVAFYQTRDAILAQQEAVAQQIKDLTARKAKQQGQLASPPPADKTCTFAKLDQMKDDLGTSEAKAALLSDKLSAAQASANRAEAALDDLQVKCRQAQSAYESGKQSAKSADLQAAADRAKHNVELASETLALRKSDVTRAQLAQEVQQLSVQILQDKVERTSPLVTFTDADFREQIEEIKKNQTETATALSQAEVNLRAADADLSEIKKQLEATAGADNPLLKEKAAALWRTRQRLQEELDSNSQRMQQLSELETAWNRRFEIASKKPDPKDQEAYDQLKAERKETRQTLEELESALRIQILSMKTLRNELTSATKKADAAAKGPADVLAFIRVQESQIEDTLQIFDQRLETIESARRVHEKLLDEINASLKTLTPESIALGAWHQFKSVWDYSFNIGDKPISVGMSIQGLTTLILGWMFSRFASAMVAYRVLKRFHLSKDATSAIRSLVFYSMLFAVALESMRMVNVDLTAFTVLGGALAIGVGFGSQALINNFIGGLIMLAERPVRLGERITFGSTDGVVEDVGFRCTKVRTSSDHLLTIPNSTLVNESIENIDRRRTIRRNFNIAVTYNITREALAAAVQKIRDILEEKEIRERIHPIVGFEEFLPRVYFSDFAAESLNIQIAYWYAPVDSWAYMEHAQRVNFRIMEEFERMGIDFAFPSKTSYVKNAKKVSAIGREPGSFAA